MRSKRNYSKKGCVTIQSDKGLLRLRWKYQGKTEYLYLGFPDSEVNRRFAQQKASVIEVDLLAGTYDLTKQKYSTGYKTDGTTITQLLEKFSKWKRLRVTTDRSLNNYRHAIAALIEFYGKDIEAYKIEDGQPFINWLMEMKNGTTPRTYLQSLCAIWKQQKVEPNPWQSVILKTPVKQPVKPFTDGEVRLILEAFEGSRYIDLITFLFSTGCRIGESLALKVKDFDSIGESLWIASTMSDEGLRPAKSNKGRTIPINDRIFEMMERLSQNKKPNDFIFPWRNDSTIGTAWKKRLARLGIEYRSIHNCRRTFVSTCLEKGLSPMQVASISGHSEKVMFTHYVGSVTKVKSLPDIL